MTAIKKKYVNRKSLVQTKTENLSSAATTTTKLVSQPPILTLTSVHSLLGILLAGDNMLYSIGLFNLPLYTYSLLCATQLTFNAVFSFFINSQKFTAFILNSVILLILSASIIAERSESSYQNPEKKASKANHMVSHALLLQQQDMLCCCPHAILLRKSIKERDISLIATCVCIMGLFANGEWKGLRGEMEGSKKGKLAYTMVTFTGIALCWQVCSVGIVGLVFVLSSLFSNVISMLPCRLFLLAVWFLQGENGCSVVALLLAMWGFASYIYQHYLDDMQAKMKENGSSSAESGSSMVLNNPTS